MPHPDAPQDETLIFSDATECCQLTAHTTSFGGLPSLRGSLPSPGWPWRLPVSNELSMEKGVGSENYKKVQTPWSSLRQLRKAGSAPELWMRLAKASVTTALQLQVSLCPILPPSLPSRRCSWEQETSRWQIPISEPVSQGTWPKTRALQSLRNVEESA